MKKNASIVILLLAGFCLGWAVDARSEAKTEKSRPALTAADAATLVRLYPTQHALSALHSMRVHTLLRSNDVAMAERLLLQNVQSHLSSLEVLGQQMELSERDQKTLQDGKAFLGQFKK